MKNIAVKCGIYDTAYTLTAHRDGTVTVKAPYIKWLNNTGNLAFQRVTFKAGQIADAIKKAFADQDVELVGTGYEYVTLRNAIEGDLGSVIKTK